jgi:nitrogen fixation NifU-like protein
MKYSLKVIQYCENPEHVGSLDKTSCCVGSGIVGSPACGDVMKLDIKVNDQDIIEDAKFKTFGCGSAIASMELATRWIIGKTLDEAAKVTNAQIIEELDLPPVKVHCSVLASDAIQAAIEDYRSKHGDDPT